MRVSAGESIIDPLYRIDFPVPGGVGTQYYYYHKPSPNPGSLGYPQAAQGSSPAWVAPFQNSDPAAPEKLQKTTLQWHYLLAKVVPPPGDLFATRYQYYRDYGIGANANGANLLSNILLPNGTVTGYDYAFQNRGDYAHYGYNCSEASCWHGLVHRSAKGAISAGLTSDTSQIQTRTWEYEYDFVMAPASSLERKKTASVWRVKVYWPAIDSNAICEVHYFNPWFGYANASCMAAWDSIECATGDCPANGTQQGWRIGLLLRKEIYTRTLSKLLSQTTYNYTKRDLNLYRIKYGYAYWDHVFVEFGFAPLLSSQVDIEFYYKADGSREYLFKTKTWSEFDRYGNPKSIKEYGDLNILLRSTAIDYAWGEDSGTPGAILRKQWLVGLPSHSITYDASNAKLQESWRDYFTDDANLGLLSKTREWVSSDGNGQDYIKGTDWLLEESGDAEIVTVSEGHAETSSGPLTVVRKKRVTKTKGTPTKQETIDPVTNSSIVEFRWVLDSNGLAPLSETVEGTTQYTYDAGRLAFAKPPDYSDSDGNSLTPKTIRYQYSPSCIASDVNGAALTWTCYDGFGNQTRKGSRLDDVRAAYEDTYLDTYGRATYQFLPFFSNASTTRGYVNTAYDGLGRPTAVLKIHPGAAGPVTESETSYRYFKEGSLQRVEITSRKSADSGTVARQEWYDSEGNLVKLVDATSVEYTYEYNALNQLTKITGNGQVREFSYNNQGQLLWSKIPETKGLQTSYRYDQMGNQVSRMAPDGTSLKYAFDFASRQIETSFDDGSKTVTVYGGQESPADAPCSGSAVNESLHTLSRFNIGANGRVVSGLCYHYDSQGRLYKESTQLLAYKESNQQIAAGEPSPASGSWIWEEKAVSYRYNDFGILDAIVYPSGREVRSTGYNAAGLTTGIEASDGTPIASGFEYGPDLSLQSYLLPGGAKVEFTQDAFGRASAISLSDGARQLYKASESYFPSGSLKQQTFEFGSVSGDIRPFQHTYGYNDLHMLVSDQVSQGRVPTGSITYAYDTHGNLTSRLSSGLPNSPALTLSAAFDANNRKTGAQYDDRGNLVRDIQSSDSYQYNQLNQITGAGSDIGYSYDPQGRRLISAFGYSWDQTAYFYSESGQVLAEMESVFARKEPWHATREYIYAGGRLIAEWSAEMPLCVATSVTPVEERVPGVIVSAPDRSCFEVIEEASVLLTATPNYGFHYLGWTVDGAPETANPLLVQVDNNREVVANFEHDIFCLQTIVSDAGWGSISLDPPGGCYPSFSTVRATAAPATGYHFDHWQIGETTSTENPIQVEVDADNKPVRAVFESNCPTPRVPEDFTAENAHKDLVAEEYKIRLRWRHITCPYAVQYQLEYREDGSAQWLQTPNFLAEPDGYEHWTYLWTAPKGCQYYQLRLRSYEPTPPTGGIYGEPSLAALQQSTTTQLSPPETASVWCAKRLPIGTKKYDVLAWTASEEELCLLTRFVIEQDKKDGLGWRPFVEVTADRAETYYQYPKTGTTDEQCGLIPDEADYRIFAKMPGSQSPTARLCVRLSAPPSPPLALSEEILALPPSGAQTSAALDFNGDGLLDLMLPAAFFTGNGDGTFTDQSALIPAGASPVDLMAAEDLTGDGLPDRILARQKSLWIESLPASRVAAVGPLAYIPGPSLRLETPVKALAIGLLPELGQCVVALTETALVALRLEEGAWVETARIPISSGAQALALGDLNGDGANDLLVGGGAGTALYSWSTANQEWEASALPFGNAITSLALYDANGDGFNDVAVAQGGGAALYLFTHGEGGEAGWSGVPVEGALASTQVQFANLMGDPRSGLLVLSSASGQSAFWRNDSLGGLFPTGLELPDKVLSAATGDFNGDGWQDLAVFYKDAARLYLSEGVEPKAKEERAEAPARSDWEPVAGTATERTSDRAMVAYGCPAQDAIAIEARSNAQAAMVFAATAAPPRPAGFEVTTWAGGKVFLPSEEVGAATSVPQRAAFGAFIPGNYLYPVPDVTGTPRVWANASGQIVTKIMTGPYGEELGFYEEPCYSDIAFAGNIRDRFTGLSYTPNRYLDNLNGRFLSVDPSNALEIQDPRSYNQYIYVLGHPLILVDPSGLAAWDIENEWNDEYIEQYRNFVARYSSTYSEDYTCEDYALKMLIEFSSFNNLPLAITNGSGTFDAASEKYNSMWEYWESLAKSTAASDLQQYEQNTVAIPLDAVNVGDLLFRRQASGRADHVQVVVQLGFGSIGIRQGNYWWGKIGKGDPNSPYYIGTSIQEGTYYLAPDRYYRSGDLTEHALTSLRIQARTWNFMGWNK